MKIQNTKKDTELWICIQKLTFGLQLPSINTSTTKQFKNILRRLLLCGTTHKQHIHS
jgi:hypothetical protein